MFCLFSSQLKNTNCLIIIIIIIIVIIILDLRQRIGSVDDRSWPVRCSSSCRLVIFRYLRYIVISVSSKQHEWDSSIAADIASLNTRLPETSPSSSSCSVCSTQRRLASRTAHFILWSTSGWWGGQSCSLTTSWSQALWASSVSMRRQGRSRRHLRPRLPT